MIQIYIFILILYKYVLCGNCKYIFYESFQGKGYGFSNQLILFRHQIFKLMEYKIQPQCVYIHGPYSNHIGMLKGNCSIRSFFILRKSNFKNLKQSKFSIEQVRVFLNQINFLKNNFNTTAKNFIPFLHDTDNFFKPRFINHSINIFKNFLLNPDYNKTLKFSSNGRDKHAIPFEFFDLFDFHSEIYKLTESMKRTMFDGEPYIAIHLRLKDFEKYCEKNRHENCFFKKEYYYQFIKRLRLKKEPRIFVLTNENLDLKKDFNMLTINSLKTSLSKLQFKNSCFLKNIEYLKIFIEIIIACQSKTFYFNKHSSFSGLVKLLCRKNKSHPNYIELTSEIILEDSISNS